jgi:hypothetical protein
MVKKEVDEEIVVRDEGLLLVVSKVCFTSCKAEGEDWRRNISQSTCKKGGKVCKPVIDLGSYKNVVSEQAIWKLNLEMKKDPSPYRLEWLKKEIEVTIFKCCLVSFSIGTKYRDKVWYVVVAMNDCHLLLDRL